ncbi:endonuclease/exonuclease/phosphatase family protein [Streptomyces poriticola]|uniref:endonuclease/exonuclease/phosphatase family protein n=1 Tax=Streptomyces poriticola TaxID=3120506 RepID=UPI002FCE17EF
MHLAASASRTALRRRRGRLTAASALALTTGLAALAPQPPADPSPAGPAARALTVATWNMCGIRRWGCAYTGTAAAKQQAVRHLVTAGAHVVLLQETCAAQVESVRAGLGRTWQASFRPYGWRGGTGRTRTVPCDGPGQGAAGFAILSAHSLSSVGTVSSPQPVVGLQRGILCGTITAHDVRVCNAHLTVPRGDLRHPGREYRDGQLRALLAAVPGRRTVFGGDFNLRPPVPGNPAEEAWPAGPYRRYRECDQESAADRSGPPTHASGHKLDYLFTGLPLLGCAVHDTGVSDHRALLIRVDDAAR